jgi:8-oxo-dGTP pyrophosphatase MutT (NUDIX family)
MNFAMNNFPITKDGKVYWVARNVAVACFVFAPINGEWCVLANQRGKGTPDFQGLWNCPCGYLDYNETTKEAAKREVYEETGIKINLLGERFPREDDFIRPLGIQKNRNKQGDIHIDIIYAGVPKGERNVKQGYLLKDAIEEANKFAEKWGYDKLSQNATL